jgi:hypothetical protein
MYSIDFLKNRLKGKQEMTEVKEDNTYDLEKRLIDFAVCIIQHKICKRGQEKSP